MDNIQPYFCWGQSREGTLPDRPSRKRAELQKQEPLANTLMRSGIRSKLNEFRPMMIEVDEKKSLFVVKNQTAP